MSPGRTEAPFTVMCASIWAGVQYMAEYGGRATTCPFSRTSSARSSPQPSASRRYSSGSGSCAPGAIRAASSASNGTIQGEIDVANDLPRNGPSGTYSRPADPARTSR